MSRAQSRDALNDTMSESEEEEMRARMAKMRGSRSVGEKCVQDYRNIIIIRTRHWATVIVCYLFLLLLKT